MLADATKQIKIAIKLLLIFTLLTGFIYPLTVTGIAQLLFPWKANGSIIKQDNKSVGSLLIGQSFTSPTYFWGRPSATNPFPYNATASSGSNLGPTNPAFIALVKKRIALLHETNPSEQPIPVDLVTASGSGLDPEISPLAALYQVSRVAKARGIPEEKVRALVQHHTKNRTLWILGEPRVNVLQLNLALDNLPVGDKNA